jgi:hypothetical protein
MSCDCISSMDCTSGKQVGDKWECLYRDDNTDIKELSQLMYQAYTIKAGGQTWDGKPMPEYKDLGHKVQLNWLAAAKATYEKLSNRRANESTNN